MTERNLDNGDALRALFVMLHGGPSGYLALTRPGEKPGWVPPRAKRAWMRLVEDWSYDGDLSVMLLPWRDRNYATPLHGNVLWAHTVSGGSSAALDKFRPTPTFVVREGSTSRRTALWALHRTVDVDWVERGNKRIAHRLGTPKKNCGTLGEMYVPGTVLRKGRKRPVAVHLEHFNAAALYTARQVVGHLRDAPDPNAWKERADAA